MMLKINVLPKLPVIWQRKANSGFCERFHFGGRRHCYEAPLHWLLIFPTASNCALQFCSFNPQRNANKRELHQNSLRCGQIGLRTWSKTSSVAIKKEIDQNPKSKIAGNVTLAGSVFQYMMMSDCNKMKDCVFLHIFE